MHANIIICVSYAYHISNEYCMHTERACKIYVALGLNGLHLINAFTGLPPIERGSELGQSKVDNCFLHLLDSVRFFRGNNI